MLEGDHHEHHHVWHEEIKNEHELMHEEPRSNVQNSSTNTLISYLRREKAIGPEATAKVMGGDQYGPHMELVISLIQALA